MARCELPYDKCQTNSSGQCVVCNDWLSNHHHNDLNESMRAERERAISDPAFIAAETVAADTMTAIRSVVDMLDRGIMLDSDAVVRIQSILWES